MASGGEREKLTRYRLLVTRYFQLKGVFMSRIRFSVSVVFGFVFSFVASHLTAQQEFVFVCPDPCEPLTPTWCQRIGPRTTLLEQIISTPDGNHLVLGEPTYLAKLRANGTTIWQQTYPQRTITSPRHVILASDGGFLITANTFSTNDNNYHPYLIRTDSNGVALWEVMIPTNSLEYIRCSSETSDGGFFSVGTILLRTDSRGNKLWQTPFEPRALCILRLDNSFVVVRNSSDEQSIELHAFDLLGMALAQHTLIPPNGFRSWIQVAAATLKQDQTILLAGLSNTETRSRQGYLLCTTASGEILWAKMYYPIYSGAEELSFQPHSVIETADSGCLLVGETGGFPRAIALHTDSRGVLSYDALSIRGYTDGPLLSVSQTSDKGYMITGEFRCFPENQTQKNLLKLPSDEEALPISTPSDLTATFRPPDSIELAWKDTSFNETKVLVERKLSLSTRWSQIATLPANTSAYIDPALIPDTYCYRVTASNSLHASPPSQVSCADIWAAPLPPNQFSAQLRTEQSIGLDWIADNGDGGGAQVANDITYVLEKKTSSSVWQKIGETAVNVYKWIDTPVQPNEDITFRISAKNANGTSATVQSNTIRTPESRWQLKIYDPESDRWVNCPKDKAFNPDWGTAVIVHGWQFPESNSMNGWVLEVAQVLYQRLNHNVNVLAWDWVEEATNILPGQPAGRVDDQAKKLAESLFPFISQDPTKPVHLMGHSLGTHLVIVTAGHLGNKGNLPEQLTLWDTPDTLTAGIGYIDENIKLLRQGGVYIDTYSGCTGLGTHNSHIWVKVQCLGAIICQSSPRLLACHSEPHDWYEETINKAYIQSVHLDDECDSLKLPGGLGFRSSILLPENKRVRIPNLDCEDSGTLMFSKLCRCTDITPLPSRFCQDEVYGLTGKRNCIGNSSPQQKSKNTTTRSVKTQRSGQGGGAQVEEIIAQYHEELFINPEWDYISMEYDFISAPAPADLKISLVQGEITYPIFSLNSEIVFNEEFLDTGLKNVTNLHSQSVTLVIELGSVLPDAEVQIRNITFWQDHYHDNMPPAAHAGIDQTLKILCGESIDISLDGSETFDPDENDALEFQWVTTDGLLATEIKPIVKLTAGEYAITLIVEDSAGNISGDQVKIRVDSEPCPFKRGDSNGDGTIDISDAINTLGYLFNGQGNALCRDASDANDDGTIDISDAIATLGFLFLGNNIIPPPFTDRGVDPSEDSLGCDYYASL